MMRWIFLIGRITSEEEEDEVAEGEDEGRILQGLAEQEQEDEGKALMEFVGSDEGKGVLGKRLVICVLEWGQCSLSLTFKNVN